MSYSTLDVRLTREEERRLFPPVDEAERYTAIGKAVSDFDATELGDALHDGFEQLMEMIAAGDMTAVGTFIAHMRRQKIADIASFRLYGAKGHIQASEVTL